MLAESWSWLPAASWNNGAIELFEKFGLEFHVYSKELEAASPSGNPFEDHDHLIVRLDQMSRNEESQDRLSIASWDLVIFDEAHKLSAHFFGKEMKRTKRFNFAEKIGQHARHLLLMTATPHNGKEEDFQLFLSLLDSDRFYGKFRDGVHKVDCSDLMRRMVKEEMVKFDGTKLFPERKAYTVNYKLSDIVAALYESVTQYVQTEMGKADQLDGSRKGSVGFALAALQRRLDGEHAGIEDFEQRLFSVFRSAKAVQHIEKPDETRLRDRTDRLFICLHPPGVEAFQQGAGEHVLVQFLNHFLDICFQVFHRRFFSVECCPMEPTFCQMDPESGLFPSRMRAGSGSLCETQPASHLVDLLRPPRASQMPQSYVSPAAAAPSVAGWILHCGLLSPRGLVFP